MEEWNCESHMKDPVTLFFDYNPNATTPIMNNPAIKQFIPTAIFLWRA